MNCFMKARLVRLMGSTPKAFQLDLGINQTLLGLLFNISPFMLFKKVDTVQLFSSNVWKELPHLFIFSHCTIRKGLDKFSFHWRLAKRKLLLSKKNTEAGLESAREGSRQTQDHLETVTGDVLKYKTFWKKNRVPNVKRRCGRVVVLGCPKHPSVKTGCSLDIWTPGSRFKAKSWSYWNVLGWLETCGSGKTNRSGAKSPQSDG